MRKCPHCDSNLIPHRGVNDGFFHCNGCGCCFDGETKELRAGTTACTTLSAKAAIVDESGYKARIAELESQLKNDESASLKKEVESLNKELEERQEAYQELQEKLKAATTKAESK